MARGVGAGPPPPPDADQVRRLIRAVCLGDPGDQPAVAWRDGVAVRHRGRPARA
ncbi:MAG: hypothetical protein E6I81_04085 [Chloroflexi bacterium]|nr:MAG: hypothetical protein E6J08_11870 [Chloroflexota bacterium]TMD73555.1 MAG: hypothetical protein E6I81_04085 [Chloroflexota bacterium]TME03697.1 MAG: hypothetical protein E6I71_08885 [Chloroflexota bacterium]